MTVAEFRALALAGIKQGAAYYGQYFADHNDGTLYKVSRWLNLPEISTDDYWTKDDPDYQERWLRAMRFTDTLHLPRRS